MSNINYDTSYSRLNKSLTNSEKNPTSFYKNRRSFNNQKDDIANNIANKTGNIDSQSDLEKSQTYSNLVIKTDIF